MVELLEVLDRMSWPTWIAAGGFLLVVMMARLVAERARRRTYQVVLADCQPQTLLIDVGRHRQCLILYRGGHDEPPRAVHVLAARGPRR
jgi:hypothetical protein